MPQVHIIGLGRSGIAAARLLKKDGWDVKVSDRSFSPNLQELQQTLQLEGITVQLGYDLTLTPPDSPNLIVVSPGVPWDVPSLLAARNQGIETIGELELAWRYLQSYPWIGVTGTNGKTTTTALITAIFQAAGLNAPACGNIGYAACELALLYPPHPPLTKGGRKRKNQAFPPFTEGGVGGVNSTFLDWIIAEISSYQIESSPKIAPKIGIWTTFTPDHLNRHKTLDNYYQIKASLLQRSTYQVLNGDDPYLRNNAQHSTWKNPIWTSIEGKNNLIGDPAKGVYIEDGWVVAFNQVILPVSLFKMVGKHNQQNLLMAVAAAALAGIEKGAIARALATFPGVPHRLEYIRTVNNIDYINDSKATNYDAAAVGLTAVNSPVILIAGGEAKEGDDTHWINLIKTQVTTVLLIGDAAPIFAQRFQQLGYENFEIVETMEKAVKRASFLAPQQQAKVVLLSPACASFDQYQSFEHRGEHFRQLCLNLMSN